MSTNVYAFGQDQYWLDAMVNVRLENVLIKTVPCQECLTDCLNDLPEPDPSALVLIDIFSHRETIENVLRTLRGRGWRNIVVIAADPSVKESRSVFREGLGLDYWSKTYDAAIIQSKIEKCLRDLNSAGKLKPAKGKFGRPAKETST